MEQEWNLLYCVSFLPSTFIRVIMSIKCNFKFKYKISNHICLQWTWFVLCVCDTKMTKTGPYRLKGLEKREGILKSSFLSINDCLELGSEELKNRCQREERRLNKVQGDSLHAYGYIFYFLKYDVREPELFTLQAFYSARYVSIRKFDSKIWDIAQPYGWSKRRSKKKRSNCQVVYRMRKH